VVVSGRRDEAGEALANELRSLGAEAEFVWTDVRNEDEIRDLVAKTVARFGRLDIRSEQCGTEGEGGPITEPDREEFAATFDTNVLGVLLSRKHEVLAMQGQGSGSIVNISRPTGTRLRRGPLSMVGSKHAVEGITKSVALEVAKSGIRVNAVAPGPHGHGHVDPFYGHAAETRRLW